MLNAITTPPKPLNEPILSYAKDTQERSQIKSMLKQLVSEKRELPSIINGKEILGSLLELKSPHKHNQVIAKLYQSDKDHVQQAIEVANKASYDWSRMPFDARAAIFLRAAEILANSKRSLINAATMLGQSKTIYQAEIDAACELIDFWRFNVYFARSILKEQPISTSGNWNRVDYRPLEGFVLAITPFNFTSIAGNLPTAPALMGNTVVWKPATTSALATQIIMDTLIEAGLPDGVINLIHVQSEILSETALLHPTLSGIHFTGSTATFRYLWSTVGKNLERYNSYPRIVGETGGKNFIFSHVSSDIDSLITAIVRGAFEYQGQKCSASSRVYIPESIWPILSESLKNEVNSLKMGDITNFENFMGAVIDKASFDKIKKYIEYAKNSSDSEIFIGGKCDDSEGYFIEPTIILTSNPRHQLMCEEIFGPVVTIYRYPDKDLDSTLEICDKTSPYALTGSIFARDRYVIEKMTQKLRFSAGNFYINDKPTGAVVGQQPFGGGRASGTNDKAGSAINLERFISPRTIKETFLPPTKVSYPYMQAP